MTNILLVVSDELTGLQYHRQMIPHSRLLKNFNYKVDRVNNIDAMGYDQLKNYQIVQFLRLVSDKGKTRYVLERCRKLGIKIILDIDDYWKLPEWHPLYRFYKEKEIDKQTEEAVKGVDLVTTTTPFFRDVLRPLNKNVAYLPNCIDRDDPQWTIDPIIDNRVRIGWVGGIYHYKDLELIRDSIKKLWHDKQIWGKWQLVLGGFSQAPDYKIYESIFTDELKELNYIPEYRDYLRMLTQVASHLMDDKPYKRVWGTNVHNYGHLYNSIDVSIVPLSSSPFSACKSQLKILEAGTMKKAVIASKVMPYTLDLNDQNAYLMEPTDINWHVAFRKILDHSYREDIAESLHELVTNKYDIDKWTQVRHDLYSGLVA